MKNNRLANLKKSYAQLKEFADKANPSKQEMAGTIQAFEFTFECLWKALQTAAEGQGFEVRSPKSAFQQAYKLKLTGEEDVWVKMLEDRNLTVHTYNEQLAQQIVGRIQKVYVPELGLLIRKIESLK